MGSFFITTLMIGLFSCLSSISALLHERAVIYKEVDRNIVNPINYLVSFTVSEIPYSILLTYNSYLQFRMIITAICYPLVGYNATTESVAFFFAFVFLDIVFLSFLGQLLAFLVPNLQVILKLKKGCGFGCNIFNIGDDSYKWVSSSKEPIIFIFQNHLLCESTAIHVYWYCCYTNEMYLGLQANDIS